MDVLVHAKTPVVLVVKVNVKEVVAAMDVQADVKMVVLILALVRAQLTALAVVLQHVRVLVPQDVQQPAQEVVLLDAQLGVHRVLEHVLLVVRQDVHLVLEAVPLGALRHVRAAVLVHAL